MARVLVVDDERSICVTLRSHLESDGHCVATAGDVDEAVALLRSTEFDVVVSDLIMPGSSGIQLLEQVKNIHSRTQVLLMTGDPSLESATAAVRGGAADYLVKPARKEALLKAVDAAIKVKQLEDDRHRLEGEVRKHAAELEERVKARTTELSEANRELSKALEEVRASQQLLIRQERLNALAQMVAGVAHDFNNSLMPIIGLSELLIEDKEMSGTRTETVGLLKTIHAAAQDAREIVRRLREFYKPDERLELIHEFIRPMLEETVRMVKPRWEAQALASSRNIEVAIECEDDLKGWVNPAQIREVIMNLLVNACDAIKKDGAIRVGAKADKQRLLLWVSDSGAGMSEEILARCIEPFFTTKGAAGTGLGLSMCYGIVRRHSGDMSIVSRLGEGTTVRIALPLEPLSQLPCLQESVNSEEQPPRLRILLVDDEPKTRVLVETYFGRAGHWVRVATSGNEALAILRQESFDVILTDRAMPGMSGDELAAAVRGDGGTVPIVMLTGFGDLMLLSHEQPEGVDLIVPKPASAKEIEKAVFAAYLRKTRQQKEGGETT